MPRPVENPPNPWSSTHVDWLGEPPPARLEVFEEEARSIISGNDSPDVGFSFSVNAYRGCYHGCIYCYARPSHQYLGFGAGSDFERKIVVKTNAPVLLYDAFMKRSWEGGAICFSGNTDCYQPLEASYGLTRACLETCLRFRNPISIITKGALIRRDTELLANLARVTSVRVYISIPFADDETARRVEPYASSISMRFEALRVLSEAGVPTGVALAPIIPGLSESHVAPVLERARACGAEEAFMVLLRLPNEVLPVFNERIEQCFSPERVRHIRNAVSDMRDGRMNDAGFGSRMRGTGARYEALSQLYHSQCRRLGFNTAHFDNGKSTTFIRPGTQQSLF